jgi:hypothetical protein
MALTHKKKFKNQIVNNHIFSKLKKKKRDLKYIGGVHPNPNNSTPAAKRVMHLEGFHRNMSTMSTMSNGSNVSDWGGDTDTNNNDEFGKPVSNAMMTGMNNTIGPEGVVSDQSSPMNVTNNNIDEFPHTNTRFIESELKYNPFYAKKSSSIVENKRMYNLDTNYLMSEIKKKQTADPDFIVTSEIISNILAGKQKASVPIPLDYTKQQELHIDFCDF